MAQIPQVTSYFLETDDRIRALVAVVLGTIIADQTARLEVESAITYLEKLSQDSSSLVRKAALQSLGKIESDRAIPSLELALKDSDLGVVAIASQILQHYKRNPMASKQQKAAQTLPPNATLKNQIVT